MSAFVDVLPHRPSLLDRRPSSNLPEFPDRLSVSAVLAPPAHSATGSAFARGTSPRKPPTTVLSFAPLTPIMASPLLTPEVAPVSTPVAVVESAARSTSSGHDPPHNQDYISHHVSPPHPTWTTSPPTPPSKMAPSPRVASPSGPSPTRVHRGRSKSHSKSNSSRSSSSRPASIASYAPTPLSRSYSPSSPVPGAVSSASSRVDWPANGLTTRRLSLPAYLSKPLPPRPPSADGALADMSPVSSKRRSAVIDDADAANEGALLPSLSRRAATTRDGSASGTGLGRITAVQGRGRKLFSLDDGEGEGDLSDSEERGGDTSGARKRDVAPAPHMVQERLALDPERERDRAERVRRYHALMELLTTEVGYLLDLRILVTVYLDQLLVLSKSSPDTRPPTPMGGSGLPTPPLAQPCLTLPLPSPGRSMSTLSALSIFPSSRSSFFHNAPASSPSPIAADFSSISAPDNETESRSSPGRTRQSSGTSTENASREREKEREREREKENLERVQPLKSSKSSRQRTSVLAENEVRAVYRNARELLVFHEQFVSDLRAAVGLVGFGMMFSGDEGWLQEMRGEGENVVTDLVEHAVEVVATKITNEAASFSIYETFCPGHAAATDLVRRAQERWPVVWEAYEQRCALLMARNSDPHAHPHYRGRSENTAEAALPVRSLFDETELDTEGHLRAKRRHSTPTLSLPSGAPLPFPSAASPHSATLPPPTASPIERPQRGTGPRLKFMDYLIKPVQRICKYPLLLDQLRPKRGDASTVREAAADEAVRRAGEAMRRVVSRVNCASEKEAHNLRSALIASRVAFAHSPPAQYTLSSAPSAYPTPPPTTPSSSASSSSSHGHGASTAASPSSASSCVSSPATPIPSVASSAQVTASLPPLTVPSQRPTTLTAEFVSSLGPCMLAGALDVIQPPSHRAKYLGAFLYAGGYCVLVKITKSGRVYEPRHWFPFGSVEVVDVEEDDPSFPYSFRISALGRHIQLGAACAQEKAVWLSAINDALRAKLKPSWVNEPLSSFQADEKSPHSAAEDTAAQESPPGLPAIQSLSDLEKQADATASPSAADGSLSTFPPGKGQLKYSRTLSRLDSITLRQDTHPPVTISAALSRRSSTASVKAFFTPFDSTRTTRPSAQVRAQVEQGLHDIFSETCLGVRAQAQMRGEELFQVRAPPSAGALGGKRQGSGIPRSNSGISIANAMGLTAAKRRYDSVLVSRRKASMDGVPDLAAPGESAGSGSGLETGAAAMVAGAATGVGGGATGSGLAGRARSLAVRRQKKQPASIGPAITTAIAQFHEEADSQRRGSFVQSPETFSTDSSTSSRRGSMLPSPTGTSPPPIPISRLSPDGTLRQSDIRELHNEGTKPKRSRSMVSHVRSIFHQRLSDSPSSYDRHASSSPPLLVESPSSEYPSGIVQWLRRTSLRRRESSSSSSRSTDEQHYADKRAFPSRSSTEGMAGRDISLTGPPTSLLTAQSSPRRVASNNEPSSAPKRRRSVFVPASRSRDRAFAPRDEPDDAPREAGGPLPSSTSTNSPSRRSIKNILLFQRSNSLTPSR